MNEKQRQRERVERQKHTQRKTKLIKGKSITERVRTRRRSCNGIWRKKREINSSVKKKK